MKGSSGANKVDEVGVGRRVSRGNGPTGYNSTWPKRVQVGIWKWSLVKMPGYICACGPQDRFDDE